LILSLYDIQKLFIDLFKFLSIYFYVQVSKERGEELAIEYGIKFMETSAKASINVEEAFFTLARDIKCKMEKRLVIISFFFLSLLYTLECLIKGLRVYSLSKENPVLLVY
jgi:hypothetical protein